MNPRTLRQLYCEAHGLPAGNFTRHLLSRILYPHARPLAGVLAMLDRRHFDADQEFAEDLGQLRALEEFDDAAVNFVDHYSNRAFPRRVLRLRASVRRALAVAQQYLPDELEPNPRWNGDDSLTPFRGPPP